LGTGMTLTFRPAQTRDIEEMFSLRGRTRENPISREDLASLGFTPESTAARMASGQVAGWVCRDESSLVGFCSGDSLSGEILVLAVLPEFEGKGIGKQLLWRVIEALKSKGCRGLWLAASPDPGVRSYGFYRHLGWRATGKMSSSGDEILAYRPDDLKSGR